MRPRVDDPSGDFTADWNFVPDTNGVLSVEGGNSFCSSHFDPERVDGNGIGEVRQLFYPPSRSSMPTWLTGVRHCGTDEQWSAGYESDAGSVVYIGDIPKCCYPPDDKIHRGAGRADGTCTVVGVITGDEGSAGAADGTCTVAGEAAAIASSAGAADGTCTVAGFMTGVIGSNGQADGTCTVIGFFTGVIGSAGAAAGTCTVSGTLLITMQMIGQANGTCTVSATGRFLTSGAGTANGTCTVSATGRFLTSGAGTANGICSVAGMANVTVAGAGTSNGACTVAGVGKNALTAATRVQDVAGSGTGTANTSSITWPVATTAGNALFAVLSCGPVTTITPPSGWSLAVSIASGAGQGRVTIWYYANAPSHSGGESFAFVGGTPEWALTLSEYSGINPTNPLDRTQSSFDDSLSSALTTGSTSTTTYPFELFIAGFNAQNPGALATPTNGFAIRQVFAYGTLRWYAETIKSVTSAGIANTGLTASLATRWVACVATFRVK